jgi:hypothetical protein
MPDYRHSVTICVALAPSLGLKKSRIKAGGRKRPPAAHFAQQCWAFLPLPMRWSDCGFVTVRVVEIEEKADNKRDLDGHPTGVHP